MEKILAELKATSGTNDKCAILERIKDADVLKCFRLTYDPFTVFYINKIKLPECSGHADFKTAAPFFFDLCERLSKREITGNAARDAVDVFLSTCKPETQAVFIKILQKDLKVGVTDTLMNKVYGKDFIKVFEVQLAKKWSETKDSKNVKAVKYWWASRKLDGLRCYYVNGSFFTRNGHPIVGFEHIAEELKGIDCTFIDGELYSDTVSFQKIQGAVMSNKNIDPKRKKTVYFNIFVVGRDNYKNTEDMVNVLNELRKKFKNSQYMKFLEYEKIDNTNDAVVEICERYSKEGFEGVMLRHPEIWYEWKRSTSLLKHKLFREEDFKCVGFYEGEKGTKLEGKLGGIYIEGSVATVEGGNEIVFVKSGVGSGFDEEDVDEIWQNKSKYLNKLVSIKFQGITDDKTSLRFPIYLGFKEDR